MRRHSRTVFERLLHRLTHLMAHQDAVPHPDAARAPAAAHAHPEPDSDTPAARWSADRIGVRDALWGEGFSFPNGEEETLRLAKPLVLSSASSLLMVGAGAGGPPCCVATQFGAWVSGFEADPELAMLASERRMRRGLGKRVEIKTWDPREPGFTRRSYHHAMMLEALGGAQIGAVLVAVFRALAPGGQLVLVDLVADTPLDPHDPAVRSWCALEERPSTIPSERAITGALGRLGFDVRVAEDISLRHMQQALRGWHQMLRGMQANRPGPSAARLIVQEAELWLRRLSLMRARQVRLVRWHAIRGNAPL